MIKLLDKNKQRYFKYTPIKTFDFAKSVDFIPITFSEVKQLCCHFPIVIAENSDTAALAILAKGVGGRGVTAIKENGSFAGKYIPAFLRRYPFAWIKEGEDETLHLGYESESGCFDAPTGKRLFDDEGNPAKILEQILELMSGIEKEMKITQNILHTLKEREIIQPVNFIVGEGDEAKKVSYFSAINREKLIEQDDDFLLTTLKNGWMEMIELHLLSLRHLKG